MAGGGSRYRKALRSRDLRLMMLAFFLDEIGSWAYTVVLSAYAFARTGSPGWVAVLLSARWLVATLVSGPAGVISDRHDRRRVVQAGAALAGLAATLITVLVAVDAPMWSLLLGALLVPLAASVNRPASDALIPEVVDERDLAAANALFATLANLVVVLGPALGGALLLTGQPALGMAANAASFVASAVLFTFVRTAARGEASAGGRMLGQIAEGWRILIGHRIAFVLVLLLALDSAVLGAASVAYGPLSVHVGTGANGYSYLLGAQALGGVLGAAFADRLAARPRLAPVIVAGFAVECLPLAFVTATRSPVLVAVLQVFFGVGMVLIDVIAITALQRDIPRAALGRANAIMIGLAYSSTALAAFLATALLDVVGLTATWVVIGVGFPLLALLGIPAVRRNDRNSAAQVASLADRVEFLRSIDLFHGASQAVLEQLAAAAEEIGIEAGTVVIRQGDPADALFAVVAGTVRVDVSEAGREGRRPDVTAPGYVGEIGLIRGIPRTATVTAATGCRLLRIAAADFRAALETAPASRSMVSLAAERFARTEPAATLI